MATLILLPPAPTAGQTPSRDSALWLDPDVPLQQRVDALVDAMTFEEKTGQMQDVAPAIERLGVPAYNWWNEALHGVARAGLATVFPQAIGIAATWDDSLVLRMATVISDEARAKHHQAIREGQRGRYQGLTIWSPNINIFRDPRWGRGQETYGEDPYLTGRLAVPFIRGLQGDDPAYLKTVATVKHFAVHSGPEPERHRFDAVVSERDLRETYLPAFEAGIREGGAVSLMCAYNAVHGDPACSNEVLLQEILRDEWGFGGYVVSDCGAVRDIFRGHRTVATAAGAAAAALQAGTDLNCGRVFGPGLADAVRQGLMSGGDVDRALERLFTARFRLGMFDPPERVAYARIPRDVLDAPAHRALALEVARKSIVLLKNDGGVLPLPEALGTLAVIGPDADEVDVLLGNYNGTPADPVTPLRGLREARPTTRILYARGSALAEGLPLPDSTGGSATALLDEAVEAARRAEAVVLFLGLSARLEGEEMRVELDGFRGGDRTSLELPAVQETLLERVVGVGKPTVLVLMSGSAVAIDWADAHVPAILEAWYPGQAAGAAIADVLFGTYNPAGRLPVTFYRSVDDLPPFDDYAMEGRTYRFFPGDVLYPFGHGLSYTTFDYHDLRTGRDTLTADGRVTVSVDVTNTGTVAGDEVVQLYVAYPASSVERPIRDLRGFRRVHLDPGETRTVSFALTGRDVAWWDPDAHRWTVEGGPLLLEVGASSADLRLSREIRVRGGVPSPSPTAGQPAAAGR